MGNNVDKRARREVEAQNNIKRRKIAVLGPHYVGKSSIILRMVTNTYHELHDPMIIEDSYITFLTVNNEKIKLEVADTSSRVDSFELGTDLVIKNAEAFVLVYDINNAQSPQELIDVYFERIKKIRPSDYSSVPIALVGNKSDSEHNAVPRAVGEELAKPYEWLFFEVSALTGDNIKLVFEEVTKKLLKGPDFVLLESVLK